MNNLQSGETPTLICGYPKSGTTLLLALLDSHPQLTVLPEETRYLKRVRRQENRADFLLSRTEFGSFRQGRPREQRGSGNADYSRVDHQSFEARIRELDRTDVGDRDFLLGIVDAWRSVQPDRAERRRWVEKTPQNERFIHTWNRWFGPGAVYLHLVRDPRDNFTSYRKKRTNVTLDRFCLDWAFSTEIGLWAARHLPGYHLLKYEDLVSKPEAVMRQVAAWLGIDFDPVLLKPTRLGEPWLGNSVFSDVHQGVSASPVARYAAELSPPEIEQIESRLAGYLRRFDYRIDCNQPQARDRNFNRTLHWKLLRWHIRNRFPFLFPFWAMIRGGGDAA